LLFDLAWKGCIPVARAGHNLDQLFRMDAYSV
jgi:hypothetical protein